MWFTLALIGLDVVLLIWVFKGDLTNDDWNAAATPKLIDFPPRNDLASLVEEKPAVVRFCPQFSGSWQRRLAFFSPLTAEIS